MSKEDKDDSTRQSGKEIFRLFQLDALFQEDKYYSMEDLTKRLEVSVATLNRDIRRLRDNYHAPLEYSREYDGYHYSSHLYKFPAIFVTEEEMPAYGMVMKLFEMFQDTPLYAPLLNICESFESPVKSEMIDVNQVNFKNSHLREKQWFETRIVMAKRVVDSVDDTAWEIILSALKDNFMLEFDYDSIHNNMASSGRTIEPWQLIYDREQWYLTGLVSKWDNPNEKVRRTFVVPRMKNLRLVKTHFSLPSEEEWMHEKKTLGIFGIQTNDEKKLCEFIFQGSALYYSTANFGEDKTVKEYKGKLPHKDGALHVSFTSNQWPGILRDFFPFGEDIIPLAPEELITEWKNKVQAMTQYM